MATSDDRVKRLEEKVAALEKRVKTLEEAKHPSHRRQRESKVTEEA
jgi:hypothetical protein